MQIPTVSHKVKKGETLTSIVKNYGFDGKVQQKIFIARYNDKLRKQRSDPTTIAAGDVINIPAITAAKMDELIKRSKEWRDVLETTMQEALVLKDAELASLEDDRDYYLSRIRAINKRLSAGLNIDLVTRRQKRACELANGLGRSMQIGEIAQCAVLMSKLSAHEKAYRKKVTDQLKTEEKSLKDVQKNIKSVEAEIAKIIDCTRQGQNLLTSAITAARKLKSLTY